MMNVISFELFIMQKSICSIFCQKSIFVNDLTRSNAPHSQSIFFQWLNLRTHVNRLIAKTLATENRQRFYRRFCHRKEMDSMSQLQWYFLWANTLKKAFFFFNFLFVSFFFCSFLLNFDYWLEFKVNSIYIVQMTKWLKSFKLFAFVFLFDSFHLFYFFFFVYWFKTNR